MEEGVTTPDSTTHKDIEKRLRAWLRDHHGIISWYEARRLGATTTLIKRRLASGEWVTVHRGVYRAADTPRSPLQDLRAAAVAASGVGVISHTSAAWLWGLVDAAPTQVDLSIPAGASQGRRLKGVAVHRSTSLGAPWAVSNRQTIPVPNPLRTIVDLAGVVAPDVLTGAVDRALSSRLVTIAGLSGEIERLAKRGRPGVGPLRFHLLDRGFIGEPPASVLEAKTRRLIASTRLPLPKVEYTAGPDGEYRLDFVWVEIRLAIEVDGYVWHFSPEHKERDEGRRARLRQAGWTIRVFSWREICREPARVIREVVELFEELSSTGSARP